MWFLYFKVLWMNLYLPTIFCMKNSGFMTPQLILPDDAFPMILPNALKLFRN